MKTVEDCIEVLAGLQEQNGEFNIERSDYNLVNSLARQTFRGTAYTDRQYELAKQKVLFYKEQFESNGYNVDVALEELRMPLRQVDRSRWVKLVDHKGPNKVYESDTAPFIAVRFIFQKKLISNIDAIKRSLGEGDYDKENKIHYFPFSERTVFEILSNFNETNNFEVQEELKEYYEKLQDMKNNKQNYLAGIYGLKLKNLHEKSLNYAISSIGEPDIDNLCHYYDQKEKFGLYHFDSEDLQKSLNALSPFAQRVAKRTKNQVLVNPKEFTVENLAEVVLELYRLPLLIVLNEKTCYDELVSFHKAFNGIISNDSCSVLFRLDNTAEGVDFNQYIKRHNLNSPVDKDTKIVYISNNKIPKPLLQSDWLPSAAITTFSGRAYGGNKVDSYLEELDLVVHYDDDISPWKGKIIEKI
jgi:hypothetical protein